MSDKEKTPVSSEAMVQKMAAEGLDPNAILIAEFEYARETAGQAMDDRHKMINYYLIVVGVLLNAVAALSKNDINPNVLGELALKYASSAFLATLFIIGVLYLLKLIRLRLAWYGSAKAMNKIKDYYSDHFQLLDLKGSAFVWTSESLKEMKLYRRGTLFFYTAFLIILIDTLALCGAFILQKSPWWILTPLFIISMFVQYMVYRSSLKGSQ